MKPPTRAARRSLAALALTCAAVVIPSTALAASGSPEAAGGPAGGADGRGGGPPEVRHRRAHRLARHPRRRLRRRRELPTGAVQHLGPCVHAVRLSGRLRPGSRRSPARPRGRPRSGLSQPPGDAGPGRYRARAAPDHRRGQLPAVVLWPDHRGGAAGLPAGGHQVARGPLHLPGVRPGRAGLPARGDHGGRDRHPRLQQLTPVCCW